MKNFYSNGKLLITGEYVVLNGATSFAIPTKFGQDLTVEPIQEQKLIWASFTEQGECWFEASFNLTKLHLISATFNSDKEGNTEFIAETLQNILKEAKKLNPHFLNTNKGWLVKTHLTFPKNWGLGSSSTLINNIAMWANINPFTLLWNAFSGSGYDIACAKYSNPIFYKLINKKPVIKEVSFMPNFKEELYFIYLNKKQNSRDGIAKYKKNKNNLSIEIKDISTLSKEFVIASSIKDIAKIIEQHEYIISRIIKQPPIKKQLFADYFGSIKSLGAWGGDFILATGNENTTTYFQKKGFKTIIPYTKMIL